MMSFRRMLPFLLLNIIVSAVVMLAILWWWDGRVPEPEPVAADLAPVLQQESLPLNPEATAVAEEPAVEEPGQLTSAEPASPESHIVQAGETLGQISVKYDVPVNEIMAANGIDNPNFLSVGQELIIPQPGETLPEAEESAGDETNEDAGAGDGLPTPIPTVPAVEGESVLAIAGVDSPGQITMESIQIVNNGSREATMRNWTLTDQSGNTYTFGQLTLFGEGAGITLHTGSGQDSATDLYWGLDEALWNSGDRVVLYDDAGTVQAEFQVP
jgi:LysM repeat protein